MKRLLLLLCLTFAACGGSKTPTAPATVTGTIGARVDSTCSGLKFLVTTVTVTIDGVVAGTAGPGGAVTKVVPVGNHVISGRSDNGITWGGETQVTTAANPDRVLLFACI